MSVNKAIILGNLGQDPELRNTASGQSVVTLSVATSRKFKGKDGNLVEDTQWHRVVVWGKQADACNEYLSKGRQVFVEGRLQTKEWEKDGVKRYTTEIVAQSVVFIGGKQASTQHKEESHEPPPTDETFDDIPF